MLDHTAPEFIRNYQNLAAELPPPRLHRIEPKLNRIISGGIAETPGGRIWASWLYRGESRYSQGQLAYSDDGGQSWSAPCFETDGRIIAGDTNRSTMTINLWTAPDGRLFCFYDCGLEVFDGEAGIWQSICDNPDADEPVWSLPQRIWHGWALNKPIVLSNGEWLLAGHLLIYPIDPMRPCVCDHRLDHLRGANVFVSRDCGASWERRGLIQVPPEDWSFYEPMPLELSDGSIAMYIRTAHGISRCLSTDGGWSWSLLAAEPYAHPPARIFVQRLKSGRVLMVRHNSPASPPRREALTAFLSEDDGKSWIGGLLLDGRFGVSYPDGLQNKDGIIRIAYDHIREDGEYLMASFREEDILAQTPATGDCRLRQLIHRLPGFTESDNDKQIHIKLVANQ